MKRILMLVIAAIMNYGPAALAIPNQINYQGYLTHPDGSPMDTTVAMVFRIYEISYGGNMLWMETHPTVEVTGGLFHVLLGSVTPLNDLFSANRWLEIQVGSDFEMTPRQQILSVAHAYRVGTVDGASGGTITSDVNVVGKTNLGSGNANPGTWSFVAGLNDTASGNYSTVSGGSSNIASGGFSTVGGGHFNRARGNNSTVAGGGGAVAADSNSASGAYAAIGGGSGNTSSGLNATIGGGGANTASNNWATVPGGYDNAARGVRSYAAGFRARANDYGSFVWGNSTSTTDSTASFGTYTFTARCANGARFYTAHTGTTTGVQLAAGGGSWSSLCDARQKRLHGDVNSSDVLRKVSAIQLHRWSYKTQDESIQHIGPTAQDFRAAFGLGESDTTINTLDPDGVALAAIQELAKQNGELRQQLNDLRMQFQTHLATEKQTSHKER